MRYRFKGVLTPDALTLLDGRDFRKLKCINIGIYLFININKKRFIVKKVFMSIVITFFVRGGRNIQNPGTYFLVTAPVGGLAKPPMHVACFWGRVV